MLDQIQKRIERADAVAEPGSRALQHVAHLELMEAGAHIISRQLSAGFVEVIELGSSDDAVNRVANVGFRVAPPGAMANARLETGGVVARDQPLLIPDWRNATPIAQRPELQALGITSSMGIPISSATASCHTA